MAAQIFKFVSRKEQLDLRGHRNYQRWMLKVKGYVKQDSPESNQWRDEALLELKADIEWAKRHRRRKDGARIVRFPGAAHPASATKPTRRARRRSVGEDVR